MIHKILAAVVAAIPLCLPTAFAETDSILGDARYFDLDLATVVVRERAGEGEVNVDASGLLGELCVGGDIIDGGAIPLAQNLRLTVDQASESVEGRSHGELSLADGAAVLFDARLGGSAFRVSVGDLPCQRLLLNLQADGFFWDKNEPARAGFMRMELFGSVDSCVTPARWTALSANIVLGGDQDMIDEILTSMEDGESCAV